MITIAVLTMASFSASAEDQLSMPTGVDTSDMDMGASMDASGADMSGLNASSGTSTGSSSELSGMDKLNQSFSDASSSANDMWGKGFSLDMGSMSSQLADAASAAGIDLTGTPSSLSTDMSKGIDMSSLTKLSNSEADDTLKSMMGSDYMGLDSPLFSGNPMPDISFDSLNVQFADLVTDMKSTGWGDKGLVETTLQEGYASNAKDAFDQQYGDIGLKKGTSDYKIPKTAKEMISSTVLTRGKAQADSAFYGSSAYQTALNGVSLSKKVSGNFGDDPDISSQMATASGNYDKWNLSNAAKSGNRNTSNTTWLNNGIKDYQGQYNAKAGELGLDKLQGLAGGQTNGQLAPNHKTSGQQQ